MADGVESAAAERTVAAARGLFDAVTKLGSAAVVVSALSFYLGSKILDHHFFDLGAGWYAQTLPFEQKVLSGDTTN